MSETYNRTMNGSSEPLTKIIWTEERKKIERLFGEAKQVLSMVRLRLRGLTGARDVFLLTATVQNLKRLANHTARPPPGPMRALLDRRAAEREGETERCHRTPPRLYY